MLLPGKSSGSAAPVDRRTLHLSNPQVVIAGSGVIKIFLNRELCRQASATSAELHEDTTQVLLICERLCIRIASFEAECVSDSAPTVHPG